MSKLYPFFFIALMVCAIDSQVDIARVKMELRHPRLPFVVRDEDGHKIFAVERLPDGKIYMVLNDVSVSVASRGHSVAALDVEDGQSSLHICDKNGKSVMILSSSPSGGGMIAVLQDGKWVSAMGKPDKGLIGALEAFLSE